MKDIFKSLAESFNEAKMIVKQMDKSASQKKTVIVQTQLSKNAEDAQKLATDWKSKEDKQLFQNLINTFK